MSDEMPRCPADSTQPMCVFGGKCINNNFEIAKCQRGIKRDKAIKAAEILQDYCMTNTDCRDCAIAKYIGCGVYFGDDKARRPAWWGWKFAEQTVEVR